MKAPLETSALKGLKVTKLPILIYMLGKQQKKFWATMKKELFLKLKKKSKKIWSLSSRGGDKVLMAKPLKKELFCGFPYRVE